LKDTNTYLIITELPEGRVAIGNKWVLRRKFNVDGTVARLKARLVIKGYRQVYGIDYTETFASVVRFTTVKFLLAQAAVRGLEVDHLDVDTAFLNPHLKEEVYMEIPEYFWRVEKQRTQSTCYLRLHKSLYGLKQAPYEWYTEVDQYLASIGFTKSKADPNLYIRGSVYLLLFVDDNLIIGLRPEIEEVKAQFRSKWKCKDLGPVTQFIGLQIERQAKILKIHQSVYITKLLERFGLAKCNSRKLPFDSGVTLTDDPEPFTDQNLIKLYQQITGCLIYLANRTRPDISWNVTQLARFMSCPGESHLRASKEVLRYLAGTQTHGTVFDCNHPSVALLAYSDASYGTAYDGKSYTGWLVQYCGSSVSWTSTVQRCTAQSTMESELIAASEISKELAWFEKLWQEVVGAQQIPTLYCDNQPTLDIIQNPKNHPKTKHIKIRYFYVQDDMVRTGRLKIEHIASENQLADILTKQLPYERFQRLRDEIGVKDVKG